MIRVNVETLRATIQGVISRGIKAAEVDENNHLIFTLTDDSTLDIGFVGGDDGATFTPSVNDDGDISWTNDKGLDNPPTRNIRGPYGKSAYQHAVEGGYTGTEAEFDADVAALTTAAKDAEAWAIGKRDGTDVPPTDPTYHNNALFYAEQAETVFHPVKYVAQSLTAAQKAQARANINAAQSYGYGDIADLTVSMLRTDYMRARNYLDENTEPINYIFAHDEQIDFITATTDGLQNEQLVRGGKSFWWTDASMTEMTYEDTGIPVMVYVYDELTKLTIRFESIELAGGEQTVMPVLVLGAGTGTDDHGKAYLFKDTEGLVIRQITNSGGVTDIELGDFVDAKHRRLKNCAVDTTSQTVTFTQEGSDEEVTLTYTEEDGTVSYTWPDGFVSEVSIA